MPAHKVPEGKRMLSELKRLGCMMMATFAIAGCSTTHNRAPVEDRNAGGRGAAVAAAPAASAPADASKPLPGAENAGKVGYYTVKPGDTLIRIGLENGQNWKDLVKWNNLENPNIIEVGQVLRVLPPGVDPLLSAKDAVAGSFRDAELFP